MDTAKRKLIQARTNLILEQPFFGTLALQLRLVEDKTCESAWTDGSHLGYNPDYIDNMDLANAIGLVCHEVMHNAAGHPWRRGPREHYRFNVACDYAIDKLIKDAGFRVPDAMLNPAFDNKSAEWIYSQLPPGTGGPGSGQPGAGGAGAGKGKPQQGSPGRGCGEVRDAPSGGATQAEWNVYVIQAANAAKSQGKLPGSLSHLIKDLEEPKVDWKAALRRFVQETAAADYSWRQPNRRYLALGLFLPQLHSEQMPPVGVAIDTSGSISEEELRAFLSETQSIVDECQPELTYLIQCDAAIPKNGVMEIQRGDVLRGVKIHGRGGTDFRPVFEYVKENNLELSCLIYLTDLMGTFPDEAPDYPVIWVSTLDRAEAPIGETLYMLDGGVSE